MRDTLLKGCRVTCPEDLDSSLTLSVIVLRSMVGC